MNIGGACLRSCREQAGRAISYLLIIIAVIFLASLPLVLCDHYVMHIGSKSDPNAHLFSYDQKFEEATYLHNYPLGMSASKEFTDATRLATRMDLQMVPNLTDMAIDADFIGIGRIGYLVIDKETGDEKEEMSRINHMLIGNFSIDERIRVASDNMDGDFGCGCQSVANFLGPI